MLYVEPVVRKEKTAAPGGCPLFVARPEGRGERRPAILVIQEIFGVNGHIQDTTARLAGQGYVAVAPDLFHRSGEWLTRDYTDPGARELAMQLTEAGLRADLTAALDYLVAQPDVDPTRIGVTGYCLGGRLSYCSAAWFQGRIKAAAVYYGGGIAGPLLPLAEQIRCPVIGFFGAQDQHITRDMVATLEQTLTGAGVANRIYYYPGAGHGFFCNERGSFHPQSAEDAWHRTLEFFANHLGPVPTVNWEG